MTNSGSSNVPLFFVWENTPIPMALGELTSA